MVEKEVGVVLIGYGEEEPREVTGVEYTRASQGSDYDRKPLPSTPSPRIVWTRRKKLMACGLGLLLLILVIALPVALLTRNGEDDASSGGTSEEGCTNGMVGSFCNLNSTCVCTSTLDDCQPLASSLFTLTQTASTVFNTTLSASSIAAFLSSVQGSPVNSNCSSQALLLDLGTSLDPSTQPRRLQFAQSSLLWQLAKTEDLSIVETLRTFVSSLEFTGVPDGAVALDLTQSDAFAPVASAGWTFDFAALEVKAPIVDWIEDASPNAFQQSLVGTVGASVLARISTLAAASSSQAETALARFWTSNLSLPVAQLPLFLDAVRASPVVIPFDATASIGSQSLVGLTQLSSTASFPPPTSCYPNLSDEQRSTVEGFESSVFALASATVGGEVLTSSCFPDRPVYGSLNLLHLRTPFLDGPTGLARQAVIVNEDVKTRATFRVGELLAGFPGGGGGGATSTESFDPREQGNFQHLNYVVLSFLQAMPSITVAQDFISFILSEPTASTLLPLPPSNTSTLFPLLSSLPTIEVALVGSILISNINYTLSSFSTTSNPPTLFFGSPNSNTFRLWAVQSPSTSSLSPAVIWSESATSQEVVVQQTSSEVGFERVFNEAAKVIATGMETGEEDVRLVVEVFDALGLLVS
ncbi:hypothetical protein BDY24DRAFT_375065 [Mrakia frigida]|uniref:uncharacterized protein n=1 Tax=Mrakia frigida TaxID=29902 RepID=UPI003FCBFC5E